MADPSFEVAHRIAFGTPCLNYRRSIAPGSPAVVVSAEIGFSNISIIYRRNLVSGGLAFALSKAEIGRANPTTRAPLIPKIFAPTVLIDVVSQPLILGDDAVEIVFNIPGRLRFRPRLIAPPHRSQHRIGTPLMIWTPTIEAEYYEVHVARDIEFRDRVARLDVLRSDAHQGFAFGQTYYWRVRAVAGSAVSDYSEVWSFTVPPIIPAQDFGHDADGRRRMLNQFREDA